MTILPKRKTMHKLTKNVVAGLTASILTLGSVAVSAQALDVNQILNSTRSAASKEKSANQTRESRFKAQRNTQQGRLTSMVAERGRQERIGKELEAAFEANDVKINQLTDELAKELGDLKQLFGVIQLSASEAQESYKTSYISAEFPNRSEKLRQMVAKMASLTALFQSMS